MKDPVEMLKELGLDPALEYGCAEGMIGDRRYRYFEATKILQIGDDNFDRWANSVEFEFDLWEPSGVRYFKRFVEEENP